MMAKRNLLIIGDSQVKYFENCAHFPQNQEVTVICVPGLKLEALPEDCLEATEFFDHVIVHIGTNNTPGYFSVMAKPGVLVIGDSLVKYFDMMNHMSVLFDVTTICIPGVKLEGVWEDALEATAYFNHVVVHVGTNNVQGDPVDVILNKAQNLLQAIRKRNSTCLIYFSAILPRGANYFKPMDQFKWSTVAALNGKSQFINDKLKSSLEM
ncbi:unnamed protein product [Bemisia tabaci]|uniref:SGNH hydrolase-type esterase domain-containing protein n=1 Tax=Bemisia tabaci TaxID=7038 RepID=A0A9P0AMF0_BEMTA|nr:unnamed protein product [Bemisia tabaci]